MAIGYWVLIGAVLAPVCGAAAGAGLVIISYDKTQYPSHKQLYPMPVAAGNMAAEMGIMCIIPGAIIGGVVGAFVQGASRRRHKPVFQSPTDDDKIWPPRPNRR